MVETALVNTGMGTKRLYSNGCVATGVHQLHSGGNQAGSCITCTSHESSFVIWGSPQRLRGDVFDKRDTYRLEIIPSLKMMLRIPTDEDNWELILYS
jgi:hypothetical protein